MLMYSQLYACFEHSDFFKVKDLDPIPIQVNGRNVHQKDGRNAPATDLAIRA